MHPIQELIIQERLQSFSPDDRKIIEMLFQDYTHDEIARAFGKSRPRISQRVERIRSRLSDLL